MRTMQRYPTILTTLSVHGADGTRPVLNAVQPADGDTFFVPPTASRSTTGWPL